MAGHFTLRFSLFQTLHNPEVDKMPSVKQGRTAFVFQWSEFLATDPEARVRFPALPKKKIVGLERGSLSLMSATEKLLDRKVAAPV
jgi:hypothetical protein